MPYDVQQLLNMSQPQLDRLFTDSEPGDVPEGEATGTAIVAPGTSLSPEIANFISLLAWQAKIFDAEKGVLRNKILPLGLNAIIAKVYKAKSWLGARSALTSTIPRLRSLRIGFWTRSARSARACIWARSLGAGRG